MAVEGDCDDGPMTTDHMVPMTSGSLWDGLVSRVTAGKESNPDPVQRLYDIFREVESFLESFRGWLVEAGCAVSSDGLHADLDGAYIVPDKHVSALLGVKPSKTRSELMA